MERFNKALKTKMWKYFDYKGNKRCVDVLDLLVENVNSNVNRSIGMSPKNVSSENSYEVYRYQVETFSTLCFNVYWFTKFDRVSHESFSLGRVE